MLGKIIKHEFKATFRLYSLLFVFSLTLTALNKTVEYVPMDNTIWNIIRVILMVAWALLSVFLVMGAMILAVVRFYKTMVKDEAYLTHTLPVKKSKLIIGKFITSLIWVVLSVIVMAVSVILEVMSTEVMEGIIDVFNGFADLVYEYPQILGHMALFLLMCLVAISANIFQCYASIALGQMFGQHKLAGSLVFYFIINYAMSILSTAAMFVMPDMVDKMDATSELTFYETMRQEFGIFDEFMVMAIVLQILIILICYFITNYRLSKKLNLE